MKLSISNIAWSAQDDNEMYLFLAEQGFTGLEIAPTRLFPQNPYEHVTQANVFTEMLGLEYQIKVTSVQSLWYGRTENIFASGEERAFLLDYTKKAVLFARALGCVNLVFGSPKNRNMPSPDCLPEAIAFFREIGEFALAHNAVLAFEPVPAYYGTNLINNTQEAFDFCRQVNCGGFKVNYDLGTAIYNNESFDVIGPNIELINHIHISEPQLAAIEKRELHKQLKTLNYDGYFSIEMKNPGNLETVKNVARYISQTLN